MAGRLSDTVIAFLVFSCNFHADVIVNNHYDSVYNPCLLPGNLLTPESHPITTTSYSQGVFRPNISCATVTYKVNAKTQMDTDMCSCVSTLAKKLHDALGRPISADIFLTSHRFRNRTKTKLSLLSLGTKSSSVAYCTIQRQTKKLRELGEQ